MLNESLRPSRRRPSAPTARARSGPLRARLREATREAILDAAESVFAREGTRGGRMEQVAARAGVSVGTLYNYFEDRGALVEALVASRRAVLVRRVDAVLATPHGDFREQVTDVVATIERHVRSHRGFLATLVREGLLVVDRTSRPAHAPLMHAVEALMRRGLRQRAVGGSTASELATVLLAITRAAILRRLSSRAPGTSSDARRIARLFFDGAGSR